MSDQKGLLSGFNILDLTHYVSGPYASLLMASQGANVIKIERPVVGDYSRHLGPYPDGIKDIEKTNDDYLMMKQVLQRRFNLQKNMEKYFA